VGARCTAGGGDAVSTGKITPGRRVWVADPEVPEGRAFGRIVSVDKPGYLSDGSGFVVRLESGNRVVTCTTTGHGVSWDFADED
jgi:hypothetical protein